MSVSHTNTATATPRPHRANAKSQTSSATTRRRGTPPTPPAPLPVASRHTRRVEAIKTVVEYPVAVALFVLLLPVIGLSLALVRLTSRGSPLYTQVRVGRGGRDFTIYKVRTMVHDCESLTGARWAMVGDPRVTPVGRVFRKLHLDELPQLWNVLRGEMALVGPRPERPEIVAQLRRGVKGYDFRHVVKPGITGFAQVHLPPDTNVQSVRNKVAFDRHYIREMGVGMDLYVYACTVLKVLHLSRLYVRLPHKPTEDV